MKWGLPSSFPILFVGKLTADVASNIVISTIRECVMKLNVLNAIWILALAVGFTAFAAPKPAAAHQSQENQNTNHSDSKDNANNLMYQQGLNHGQADRTNSQPHQYRLQPNDSDDRRAYESGYDQGYQSDHRANGDASGQNSQFAPGSEATGNVATQNGFQDGANDGLQDRQSGHSSRATKHRIYVRGNRGYEASSGSKDQFKASYRQAYIQGYEKGYNGAGTDHR
jgi:hypothetical protein